MNIQAQKKLLYIIISIISASIVFTRETPKDKLFSFLIMVSSFLHLFLFDKLLNNKFIFILPFIATVFSLFYIEFSLVETNTDKAFNGFLYILITVCVVIINTVFDNRPNHLFRPRIDSMIDLHNM